MFMTVIIWKRKGNFNRANVTYFRSDSCI